MPSLESRESWEFWKKSHLGEGLFLLKFFFFQTESGMKEEGLGPSHKGRCSYGICDSQLMPLGVR